MPIEDDPEQHSTAGIPSLANKSRIRREVLLGRLDATHQEVKEEAAAHLAEEQLNAKRPKSRIKEVALGTLCAVFALGSAGRAVAWYLGNPEPNFGRGALAVIMCFIWLSAAYRLFAPSFRSPNDF